MNTKRTAGCSRFLGYRNVLALALVAGLTGCVGQVGEQGEPLDDDADVGTAQEALITPTACTGGTITYGQSKIISAPSAAICFTQPVYSGGGKTYHYQIQFGPASGGNWVTVGQQLAAWVGGQFGIRIWYGNQAIVQTIKGVGSAQSPMTATFYGLSGQKYFIEVGLMFSNGNFNSLGAIPWGMLVKMQSLGLY